MRWLSSLESRLHWVAFPGLFKYLTFLGVIVFAWQWADPSAYDRLDFDQEKIMSGEVWRIFSFAFTVSGFFGFDPMGALFLFFSVWIAILINDSLEGVWGATRTTLYLLTALLGLAASQFVLDLGSITTGGLLYMTMFFAFATYFPNIEFLLMFIIPVKVRYFAWAGFAFLVVSVISMPLMLIPVIPALLPYMLWVLPQAIRGKAGLAKAARRRREFTLAKKSHAEAFHTCATCKRTEHDDDDLQFRVMPDGTEYCIDHLPVDDTPPK